MSALYMVAKKLIAQTFKALTSNCTICSLITYLFTYTFLSSFCFSDVTVTSVCCYNFYEVFNRRRV